MSAAIHRYLYKHGKKILIFVTLVLVMIAAISVIVSGREYFTSHNIRILQIQIGSFGILSPLILFTLIFISTLIPPLPIPIPLIEIVAGLMFGFVPGIALIWISQMVSSIAAFTITRHLNTHFFKRFINNPFFNFYKRFIVKRGARGIFVIRSVMAAPFNISYMAGLTTIEFSDFAMATALGILPEAISFVYLGTLVHDSQIHLWYVLVLLVVLAILPLVTTMIVQLFSKEKKAKKRLRS